MKGSSAFGRIAALLALVGVVVVVFLLFNSGSKSYEITARFSNASQLVNGNEVILGGTSIGKIDKIELGDNGDALVSFSVGDAYAPLYDGTIATVRSPSLSSIAGRQIQLTLPPDNERGDEIPDGGTLDPNDAIAAVDLDEIFNTLDPETVADLKNVIRGLEISYDGVAKQSNRGTKYLNPLLSTSRQLFDELTLDPEKLRSLIIDGSQLSGALAARRGDVSQLVGNLDKMMSAIARQKDSLTSAVSQLPGFLRSFNTTAVNLRATLDDLDPLVNASKPVALKLRPFFSAFRSASANLVPTVRDLDTIVKDPGRDNDLVDLTNLQQPLAKIAVGPVQANGQQRQGAFPEAANALTDGLEQLSFFRAYTPELTGWFDDFGHSGIADANGGIGRIGTTFNTFSAPMPGVPIVNLLGPGALLPGGSGALTAQQQLDFLDTGNLSRCPGSNERPSPDGSNPFTDGGTLDCDPSQIPPGN